MIDSPDLALMGLVILGCFVTLLIISLFCKCTKCKTGVAHWHHKRYLEVKVGMDEQDKLLNDAKVGDIIEIQDDRKLKIIRKNKSPSP